MVSRDSKCADSRVFKLRADRSSGGKVGKIRVVLYVEDSVGNWLRLAFKVRVFYVGSVRLVSRDIDSS
jgi:hypothetical protein